MALLRTVNTEFGMSCPMAYSKIVGVQLNTEEHIGIININTYVSEEARKENMSPIKTDSIVVDNSKKVEHTPHLYNVVKKNRKLVDGDVLFYMHKIIEDNINDDSFDDSENQLVYEAIPIVYNKNKTFKETLENTPEFKENFFYNEQNNQIIFSTENYVLESNYWGLIEQDEVKEVKGDFDKCFNISDNNEMLYTNIIQQAYNFIKNETQYKKSLDV